MPGVGEYCVLGREQAAQDLVDDLISDIEDNLKVSGYGRSARRPKPYERHRGKQPAEEAPAELLRRLLKEGDLIKEAVRRLEAAPKRPAESSTLSFCQKGGCIPTSFGLFFSDYTGIQSNSLLNSPKRLIQDNLGD